MNTPQPFQVVSPPLTALCRPGQKIEQEILAGKCIIKLCHNRVLAKASADAHRDFGRTLWEHGCETVPSRVRVSVRRDHEYRVLPQGSKPGSRNITIFEDSPVPQIRLIVAASTLDYDDISSAIWHLHKFRRRSEMQHPDPNKSLETVQFTLGLLPPDPDDLEEFDEISFVEAWIGTWLVRLLKEGNDESLKAWMNAANKVLKTRAKLSAEPDYIRVQKAIESATQNGGGVACKAAVREAVDRNRNTPIGKESFRSILNTLGFDWLPDQPEWESKWLPIAESKGWI